MLRKWVRDLLFGIRLYDTDAPSAPAPAPSGGGESAPVASEGGGDSAPSEAPSEPADASEAPQGGDAPQPEGEAPPPVSDEFSWDAHMDRPVKLKVNGEEQEMSFARALIEAQKGLSSSQRYEEASQREKQALSLITGVKSDTAQALRDLGVDPDAFAQSHLEKVVQRMEETPEQKAAREYEERALTAEQKLQKMQEQQKALEQEALNAQAAETLRQQTSEAIEKLNLSPTPEVVNALATYMDQAASKGVDLTPEMAGRLVLEDQRNMLRSMMMHYDGAKLMEMMGEDILKKVREADVGRIKEAQAEAPPRFTGKTPLSTNPQEGETLAEFNRRRRKELGLL